MEFLRDTRIDFLKYRRFWVGFSLVALAVGLFEVLSGGLALGIDFTGGRQLTIRFDSPPDREALRSLWRRDGLDVQLQRYGPAEDNTLLVRLPETAPEAEGTVERILAALDREAAGGGAAGGHELLSSDYVGPQIGAELRRKGALAVVLSLAGMLAYIWARFELRFAIGAIMASIHDVLITVTCIALADLPFDLTAIAALLTVVGYSVNDTVVVFDRVRENRRSRRRDPLEKLINASLNETLSRTVMTSGTTLLATLSLLAFGGEALRSFSFVMTVGVVVGTYSTVYIAGPFTLLWDRLGLLGGGATPARSGEPGPAPAETRPPSARDRGGESPGTGSAPGHRPAGRKARAG